MDLYPLLLEPSLHVKVWGGRKLSNVLHKSLPTDEPYGESWEVHDTAKVVNGPLAGKTLGELLGWRFLGLRLFNAGEVAAMAFVWHLVVIVIVSCLAWRFGPRILPWPLMPVQRETTTT